MPLPPEITVAWMCARDWLGAQATRCPQVDRFAATFGGAAPLTRPNLLRAAEADIDLVQIVDRLREDDDPDVRAVGDAVDAAIAAPVAAFLAECEPAFARYCGRRDASPIVAEPLAWSAMRAEQLPARLALNRAVALVLADALGLP